MHLRFSTYRHTSYHFVAMLLIPSSPSYYPPSMYNCCSSCFRIRFHASRVAFFLFPHHHPSLHHTSLFFPSFFHSTTISFLHVHSSPTCPSGPPAHRGGGGATIPPWFPLLAIPSPKLRSWLCFSGTHEQVRPASTAFRESKMKAPATYWGAIHATVKAARTGAGG